MKPSIGFGKRSTSNFVKSNHPGQVRRDECVLLHGALQDGLAIRREIIVVNMVPRERGAFQLGCMEAEIAELAKMRSPRHEARQAGRADALRRARGSSTAPARCRATAFGSTGRLNIGASLRCAG